MATKKMVKKAATKADTKAVRTTGKKAPSKTAVALKAAPKAATRAVAAEIGPKKTNDKKSSSPRVSKSAVGVPSSLLGKKAPEFSLCDQSGKTVSSKDLKGKPYVLYFYPKDNTPGCTQEACDFRDELRNFKRVGVSVFGVSPDSVKSHEGFVAKHELSFPLLSDPEKVLSQAYGVWAKKTNYGREYMGIVRSTFLIGANGKVQQEWRHVRVKGHVEAVLAEAKS